MLTQRLARAARGRDRRESRCPSEVSSSRARGLQKPSAVTPELVGRYLRGKVVAARLSVYPAQAHERVCLELAVGMQAREKHIDPQEGKAGDQ